MKTTFLCVCLVYAIKCYVINETIFFVFEWFWVRIAESYLIKWVVCLTDMQVPESSVLKLCISVYTSHKNA